MSDDEKESGGSSVKSIMTGIFVSVVSALLVSAIIGLFSQFRRIEQLDSRINELSLELDSRVGEMGSVIENLPYDEKAKKLEERFESVASVSATNDSRLRMMGFVLNNKGVISDVEKTFIFPEE